LGYLLSVWAYRQRTLIVLATVRLLTTYKKTHKRIHVRTCKHTHTTTKMNFVEAAVLTSTDGVAYANEQRIETNAEESSTPAQPARVGTLAEQLAAQREKVQAERDAARNPGRKLMYTYAYDVMSVLFSLFFFFAFVS
jgi:hypothetical protein